MIEREHPEHVESLSNLATCYLRLGKFNEARSRYERALQLLPNDSWLLYNLGVISAAQGHLREAIDFYLRALTYDPSMFAAHNNLAVVYLSLNDLDKALLHFRAALALEPKNEAVRHTIRILTEGATVDASPDAYIRSLFDSYADHYDMHLQQKLSYVVPQVLFAIVSRYVRQANLKILDLGCGTGLCGEVFCKIAQTMIGVDLSGKMLALAQQKKLYDELVESDVATYLAQTELVFDLVVAGDLVVYFGELGRLVSLIKRVLKPGGYCVFNAEMRVEAGYAVTSSGRFQHHRAYIDKVVAEAGFALVDYREAVLRRQNEVDVMGHAYLICSP